MTNEPEQSQQNEQDKLMNYEECAALLDIHVSTLRRWVRLKKVPAIRMGHQVVRFHKPTVLKQLNN